MNSIDNIISLKLSFKLCRKTIGPLPSIITIVKDCCSSLKITEPNVIFCESISKDFEAFELKNEPYFIYDSCLMETLYLYNCIVFSGFNESDMDKFFYKLFSEELILNKDKLCSMYFVGEYSKLHFSFDREDFDNIKVIEHLSIQNYFLIGHELTHLSLRNKESTGIPLAYKKFVISAVATLAEKAVTSEKNISEVLYERASYFLNTPPKTIEEYVDGLSNSKNFNHFLEECYCDFMGFNLLVEHYQNTGAYVNAIISVLNCLITLEYIRDDMRDGFDHIKDGARIATPAMYFSFLRTQVLLCTIEMRKLDTVTALNGIHKRSLITDRLVSFIKNLPDKESFKVITEKNLSSIEQKDIFDVLIKKLYYISISSEL